VSRGVRDDQTVRILVEGTLGDELVGIVESCRDHGPPPHAS
jgi:hypothetical protein